MKKSEKLAACVLFLSPVLLLLAPASLFGQSPFDGTWRIKIDQAKFSPKPTVFSLNNGVYECSSCSPKIHVKADGQDQSVTGQAYDTINVREIDAKSIEITLKKNGKTISEQTRTVSDDGNTLTVKITAHPESGDQTVTEEVAAIRVGKAPAGANGTSGAWRTSKINESENGLTMTYKLSGDELSLSEPTGESYTAKLDGKDYPFKGSYSYDSVSLKRVSARSIEETEKRHGKVIEIVKMSVAPDGKKMTMVLTYVPTGSVSTAVAEKQ